MRRKNEAIGSDVVGRGSVPMLIYSMLLTLALGVSAPWWMWRIATSGRYREGLAGRLGMVPEELRAAAKQRKVVWVHAVSVGEVLAVERLIGELRAALDTDWVVAVSTTTATGQAIARKRLPGVPVSYFPLDFGFAVRRYLRVLRPALMVLAESELWPRLLVECGRAGVPVAVVNARVSDRSFPRYMRLRRLWRPLLGRVRMFLAQGEESAERLRAMGVSAERVRVVGNLKFDLPARETAMVAALLPLLEGRRLIVAGSLLEGEEELLLDYWEEVRSAAPDAVLLLAPRHPERFAVVAKMSRAGVTMRKASEILARTGGEELDPAEVILLDTIGDLAAVYGLATVAFVGGSLVAKGGHNPLEAARFGVPVVMGASYENFREVVDGMRTANAIRIVDRQGLHAALVELLQDGRAMGERGREFYASRGGATGRTLAALLGLIAERER